MASAEEEGESLLDVAKVKSLREGLELSQGDAAVRAGFKGRQAWNNIESGRQATVSLATLAKLALVLKVQARDLLKPGPFTTEALHTAKGKGSKKAKG